MTTNRNQRKAFRVDDSIGLVERSPDKEALDAITSDFNLHRLKYSLNTPIGHYQEAQLPALAQIAKRYPEIARYLSHLEEQLGRMAQQVGDKSLHAKLQAGMRRVNISAVGMRYPTQLTLEADQCVELIMQLLPRGEIVVSIARVVRTEREIDTDKNIVSVLFERLHDDDRELLIRHAVRVQRAELQNRRAS